MVVVGAYLGLYYTFRGWLNPGDEVISELFFLFNDTDLQFSSRPTTVMRLKFASRVERRYPWC